MYIQEISQKTFQFLYVKIQLIDPYIYQTPPFYLSLSEIIYLALVLRLQPLVFYIVRIVLLLTLILFHSYLKQPHTQKIYGSLRR